MSKFKGRHYHKAFFFRIGRTDRFFLEKLKFTFTANGKRQIQVKNFSE